MGIDYETWYNKAGEMRLAMEAGAVPKEQVRYMRWQEAFEARRLEVLTSVLRHYIESSAWVLDVGCGISILAQVADRLDVPVVLTGTDISDVALAKCKERWPQYGWLKEDATAPLLAPYQFDLVHVGEVIEHLPPDQMVPSLRHWCHLVNESQGSALVLTTPTPTLKVHHDQHLGFVSEGTVRKVMDEEGLHLIETHGIGLFLPLLARMVLTIPNKALRGRLYSWLLSTTYNLTILSDQAIYIGVRM